MCADVNDVARLGKQLLGKLLRILMIMRKWTEIRMTLRRITLSKATQECRNCFGSVSPV